MINVALTRLERRGTTYSLLHTLKVFDFSADSGGARHSLLCSYSSRWERRASRWRSPQTWYVNPHGEEADGRWHVLAALHIVSGSARLHSTAE